MRAQNIDHLFGNLAYTKPADEIVSKAKAKIVKINAKIEERQTRIADLRKEYGIDDAALVQLLQAARKQQGATQYTYSISNVVRADHQHFTNSDGKPVMEEKTIGAGVVNNLLTENDFIEGERDQVARLELIAQNLKPLPHYTSTGVVLPPDEFTLSEADLKYLEF